jgi:nucleotide-binding universal stress UspA family protein
MVMGIGLSPSLLANVTEAARLAKKIAQEIVFVHVAEDDKTSPSEVKKQLEKIDLSGIKHHFIWEKGDISDIILKTCKEENADLLLVGALPREGLLRYYMGSVARQLVRRSNCSIMLLTQPMRFPKSYHTIVVSGNKHPKTEDTIHKTLEIAESLQTKQITIVEEVAPDKRTIRADDDFEAERCQRWRHIIEERETHRIKMALAKENLHDVEIKNKVIFGKPGYSIGHFTQSNKADLLVLNSPDTKLGFLDRVFTHDLEYILSELPSDLLIVHSRASY